MKIGSIVVILPIPHKETLPRNIVKWLPVDDENTPYMVRGFHEDRTGVMLEEGIIGYVHGKEICIDIKFVREIMPPANVEEMIEAINFDMA